MPNRVPPHSEEFEQATIGAVLMEPSVIFLLQAEYELTPDHFYIPANREIYQAMLDTMAAGRPVDVIGVVDYLKRTGGLERVGGPIYIDSCVERCPAAQHVEYYADQLVRLYGLRLCLKAAQTVESDAYAADAEDGRTVAAKGITALCEVLKTREPDTTIMQEADASLAEWDAKAANRKAGVTLKLDGMATGIAFIDHLTNGLQPGVVVLGARESTGKTTLEGQIVGRIMSEDNAPVLRITRDSRRKALVQRDLCREAQVSLSAVSKGYMTEIYRERVVKARDKMAGWREKIETGLYKMKDVCALIRADHRKRGTKLVTLDFIQMFAMGDSRIDNDRNGKLEAIMTMLKGLTFELGIPILILSQFARDKDGQKGRFGVNWLTQKPILADLKDSGSIEQLADVAILLSKVGDILDEEGEEGRRTVLGIEVAKNKQGPTGSTFLNFHRPFFTMEPVTDNQHRAITKFLRDEHDIRVGRCRVESMKQPYFETLNHAMMEAGKMEGWRP